MIIIIIIIIIILTVSFSLQLWLMVIHSSLSDSKYLQVCRTLLGILAELNTLVWMVSIHLLISISSSLFSKPLEIVPSAPITIGITFALMFNSFVLVPRQSPCICLTFRFLSFLLQPSRLRL